jgi:DNA-binding response OmpR family regulator
MQSREYAHLRVLIVDDEPEVRDQLASGLEFIGFSVCSAANYQEARDILLKAKASDQFGFDAVCLDLRIGALSGLRLLEDVKSLWPVAERPVVICVTGDYSGETLKGALESGASGYLTKPYVFKALVQAIQEALARRDAKGYWGGSQTASH